MDRKKSAVNPDSPLGRLFGSSAPRPGAAAATQHTPDLVPAPRPLPASKPRTEGLRRDVSVRGPKSVDEAFMLSGIAGHGIEHEESLPVSQVEKEDLSSLNPGPSAVDVPYGPNCGSCSKFLALNDPRRDQPDQLDMYLAREHCWGYDPEAARKKVKGLADRPLSECVIRATDRPCKKFSPDLHRAPTQGFGDTLECIRRLSKGEVDIVSVLLAQVQKLKLQEEVSGLRVGQRVPVKFEKQVLTGEVVGFKSDSVYVVRIDNPETGRSKLLSQYVPEAREIPEISL